MSAPKVSVIVPIYNVEKYIGKCLNSIRKQSFGDYEVLLINDGTPDNSMEIAKKFADKDSRFHIYNKKNGGLSDARNYGIARARGDFLVFIDSDDYIHRDYLEVLYMECIRNNADISCCRYKIAFPSGVAVPMPVNKGHIVLDGREALDVLIRDQYLQSYAWNKMYKRTLFTDHGITYPTMYFEDIATTARVMHHANKVVITDKYLYYYVRRSGSIMTTMNSKKINDYIRSYYIIRNYLQNENDYNDYKSAIRRAGKKFCLINKYSIIRQHLLNLNFDKLKFNIDTNKMLYEYLISDEFKTSPGEPQLPEEIWQPVRKNKKVKAK